MAGRLLFVILVSLRPPTLTVNPPVITETDSVTLHCQTPPSVSVSDCYFRTVRGRPGKNFPCLQTLTGTELLEMAQRSSPAEVNMTCFYLQGNPSPDSDVSSVIIRNFLPPTLTVHPPMIRETDSVTLHCQTPPFVSVSDCYFRTVRGRPGKSFPCLQTLTGTELLEMAQRTSPAEVSMTCFYLQGNPSPDSDVSSVIIQNFLPPTLTVHPPMIRETDSVTLHCQTPPSVSVSDCYFRTVRGRPGKSFPCLQTLTGTELLEMAERSSPAEVNMTCFYLQGNPSPDSDVSSVIIQTLLPPTLTVNPPVITETDSVTLHCQTPPSVSVFQCYFYISSGGSRVFSCLKTLTRTELLEISQQSSSADVELTCFYSVKLGGIRYVSPHSETSSITIHSRTVNTPSITGSSSFSPLTQVKPTSDTITSVTHVSPGPDHDETGSSVRTPGIEDSSITATPQKTASAEIWKFVAVVTGCGTLVGVILLVSAILFNKRSTENCISKRLKANITGLQGDYDDTYSVVTYKFNSVTIAEKLHQS
ncbi:mucin-2-like [Eleginops maclovinus]|uniref:mucin-2-like n=1 Tax=Eleginops maclovinus TaxID=56733 RepID=UPI0030800E08